MEIRFAPIPKCASRSLKALGLLGEIEGRSHTKITEYPDWRSFKWFAVDRPDGEWYLSWWKECKNARNMFADWAGFKYQSMKEDLDCLNDLPSIPAPRRPGVNQWIQDGFTEKFKNSGLSLKAFCIETIKDGVQCETIQLKDLNNWLLEYGYNPVHENKGSI